MCFYVICVQLLLGRVDLGVAMDDYVTGCLFSENLRIDIRNMFHQYNGYFAIKEGFSMGLAFGSDNFCEKMDRNYYEVKNVFKN